MEQEILDHYLEFGIYTNPALYKEKLKELPDDIRQIGLLIRKNLIHRTTLAAGNTGTNTDKRFGDMTKVPWYRQPEDDVLQTAAAMLAELYRRDERGFVMDRQEKDKLVLTCRYVSILMASILKSKSIPCRVRAGNAPYFDMGKLGKLSADHWINQYWDGKKWITMDVDGSLSLNEDFDPYDMPDGKFDFPADVWLNIREGKDDPQRFYNACGTRGIHVVAWSLFYDFHSLMNHEILYLHMPEISFKQNLEKLSENELKEIDGLAKLMQKPDDNFKELKQIWNTNRKFRLLKGSLL